MLPAPKVLRPVKTERLRRKAEQERREKRVVVVVRWAMAVLIVVGVVADYLLIQWARHVEHRRQYHQQSVRSNAGETNQPLSQ